MAIRVFRDRRPRLLAPSRILRPPPRQVGGGRWREDLVADARRSISKDSKAFAFASRLLDKGTRERAWLLYAWWRRCDDIAAGLDHAHGAHTAAADDHWIKAIRVLTRRAMEGEPTADPAFDSFGQVAMEAGLDEQIVGDAIEGFAMQAAGWVPRSESDLMRYCYHVGGAPALMMARVMGAAADDGETLDRACDFGLAFELIEIARDLSESDAAGRCYLPEEWLAREDIPPGEHMKPPYRAQAVALAERLLDLAERHEAVARMGTAAMSFRQRWAVLTASNAYLALARKIRRRGARAWDRRARINPFDKLGALVKAWFEALDHAPEPFARPEWTRGEILIAVRMAGPIAPHPMTPLPDEEVTAAPEPPQEEEERDPFWD